MEKLVALKRKKKAEVQIFFKILSSNLCFSYFVYSFYRKVIVRKIRFPRLTLSEVQKLSVRVEK